MDQKQSLELFQRGRDAWNSWADEMIAERRVLEESGVWETNRFLWNKETRKWHEKAKADFRNVEFSTWADFRSFRFPGDALFQGAIFPKGGNFVSSEFLNAAMFCELEAGDLCVFSSVTFYGTTFFHNATFKGEARFRSAKFLGNDYANFEDARFMGLAHFGSVRFATYASYDRATFSEVARFDKALFSKGAGFYNVAFTRYAIFNEAQFSRDVAFNHSVFEEGGYFGLSSFNRHAGFSAVRGKALILNHPKFKCVPDFTGAHFEEAPVLDDVDLEPERLRNASEDRLRVGLPERWRALRRLAIQGHDHERELLFFKGEIVARRGTRDTWRHLWFWIGWIYQIVSDFGRSMTRPLLGLGIGIIAFACFYAVPNNAIWEQPFAHSIPCQVGSGDVRLATLLLSLHNAVPVTGIASTGKVQQTYACLYGLEVNRALMQEALTGGNTPIVPDGVALVGFCQSVVSAVFVFLVLLAVRNRFRIR